MVLGDNQHMVIRRDDQQLDAHQRAVAQVERALDLFDDSLLDSAGVDLLLLNRHCQAWVDDLHSVLARLHKGGAQRFMALHQGLDGALQRRDVEFTAQVQSGWAHDRPRWWDPIARETTAVPEQMTTPLAGHGQLPGSRAPYRPARLRTPQQRLPASAVRTAPATALPA